MLLLSWVPVASHAAALDIDGDGLVTADTDGQLVLRHLLGFRGEALTADWLGADATRDTAAVEAHLDALAPALDVDGDGKADALSDGVLILRRLQGRGGAALIEGAISPATLLDAAGIAARIDQLRTPPGEAPARVALVQANALTPESIQLDWLPTFDNDTPGSGITYVLHAAQTDNFVPDASTAGAEVVDNATGLIEGLNADTRYYVKVEARDGSGHRSWSNQLEVRTAAALPSATAVPRLVLDGQGAADLSVQPDRLDYRLGPGATPPAVGDILVSAEGDGFLRRATAVQQNGDSVGVDTGPAALDALFTELRLSTDIKLVELPDLAGPNARAAGRGVLFQRSGDTVRAVWPDSGLTIIERRPDRPAPRAAEPSPRAGGGAACDGGSAVRETEDDRELTVSYPASVCVEPNSTLSIDISAEIKGDTDGRFQVTQLLALGAKADDPNPIGVVHPEVERRIDNYGVTWRAPNGSSDVRGKGTLRWTPQDYHVDKEGRPYTAHFVALAKEREGQCTGVFGRCKKRKVEFAIDIYVSWGELSPPGERSFARAEAGVTLAASAEVDFEPSLRVEAELKKLGGRSARVVVEGPISFTTEVSLKADAAAEYKGRPPERLWDRRFVKIFYVGSVPIIISGHFTIDVELSAEAQAALDVTQVLETGYEFAAGLEYRDGTWSLIKEAQPWQRYELRGDADTRAYVELRFFPDLELTFYDAVTGRIIAEPYLFAEAALEGHFLYIEEADGETVSTGADLDYRFTQLDFGGGIDGKFRLGLEFLDRSIVGYPSADKTELEEVVFIQRTRMLGLPTLTPGLSDATTQEDCRAVGLRVAVENVENPFFDWFGGLESFNPFEQESGDWEVVLPTGGERINYGATPLDAFFSADEPGRYRLRFSGHSALGSFVRQYEEIEFDYDPDAGDCENEDVIALVVSPPSGDWTEAPRSLGISGAETIYYRMTGSDDGTPLGNPQPPGPSGYDGILQGPDAALDLLGSPGRDWRGRLAFAGCNANACGPPAGPFEYRIDLRPRVDVEPAIGDWTSSPQSIEIMSTVDAAKIYYRITQTDDGTLPSDPDAPTAADHDGAFDGPSGILELTGTEGQLTRVKLAVVACFEGSCGPVAGAYEYRIDLREGGQGPPDVVSGLRAYYPLDGDAQDASGNGHDGTVFGAQPTPDLDGAEGAALAFDGVDDYVQLPAAATILGSADPAAWSVAGRFRPARNDARAELLSDYDSSAHGGGIDLTYGMRLFIDPDLGGALNAGLRHIGADDAFETAVSDPVSEDQWGSFAWVVAKSAGTAALYIDGVLSDEILIDTEADYIESTPLFIGASRSSGAMGNVFEGAIDELRFYNKALSAREVSALAVRAPDSFGWPVEHPNPMANPYAAFDGIGNGRYHAGFDLTSSVGNGTVFAAAAGTVRTVPLNTYANENHYMGNVVIIDHDDGEDPFTLYAHLAEIGIEDDGIVLADGDRVQAGDPIGRMGDTGCRRLANPCGIHLHFEVKRRGVLGNLDDDTGLHWGYTPGYPNLYGYLNPWPYLDHGLENEAAQPIGSDGEQIIRTGPGEVYKQDLGQASAGQVYAARQRVGDWFEIDFASEHGPATGWIRGLTGLDATLWQLEATADAVAVCAAAADCTELDASARVSRVWGRQWLAEQGRAPADDYCGSPWIQIAVPGAEAGWVCTDAASGGGETPIPEINALINDTGIDSCADAADTGLACPLDGYPDQDAQYGRDATHHDDSDGHAGFSFTKLDADGNPLSADAADWSCVLDNVTGLIWEAKTDEGGLRDKDWTYSWYNPDYASNGGSAGVADGGDDCFDIARCDTDKFVADVNAASLCGIDSWRIPTVRELLSLVSNDRRLPATDARYFPYHDRLGNIWSATSSAGLSDNAWQVGFWYGTAYEHPKDRPIGIRLVSDRRPY